MTPKQALNLSGALCIICVATSVSTIQAFQSAQPGSVGVVKPVRSLPWRLSASSIDRDEGNLDNEHEESNVGRFQKRLGRSMRKKLLHVGVGAAAAGFLWGVLPVPHAEASAPVMALPKAEDRDPAQDALREHERFLVRKQQDELRSFARKCREIEANQGEAARVQFEKEYNAKQEEEASQRITGLETLKRDLLDQGIHPTCDLEGNRQMVKYTKGVDFGEVAGTMHYAEKQMEAKNFKKSLAYLKQPNRRVIQLMVQDLKNRDQDPLEYFERHTDKTIAILDLPAAAAIKMIQSYEMNMEKYGQITVPKEGELSALEKMALKETNDPAAKQKAKEAAKLAKAKAKAEQKAAKQKAKEEVKLAKEQLKEEKAKAKAAAAAAAAASAGAVAAAAAAAQSSAEAGLGAVSSSIEPVATTIASDEISDVTEVPTDDATGEFESESGNAVESSPTEATKTSNSLKIAGKSVPVIPLVMATGASGVAFKLYRDKASADEEERQRQFKLIMGEISEPSSAPALEEDILGSTTDTPATTSSASKSQPPLVDATPAPAVAPSKKKMGGFFSKKKKNARESDITVLLSGGTTSSEFATLLAKILTYGASGRFPSIEAMPGGLPMDQFSLDVAKETLIEARASAGITIEESAEIFANVVNAMLIDIVDLASSTLKEKDEKITVNAINIVVDYMNHAASLYDAVAEGVTINPVTYGGTLGKGKLEQMYSTYAVSGMMGMGIDGDFDSRVGLLQDVFEISPKKADGLMMKAMQKNMMKMLKGGEGMEGMEGMEEMMQAMSGMPGMGDMAGMEGLMGGADGEGPSPEQLKEMLLALKQMKDSGQIPASELETVKTQFKEAFGESIEDIVKDGDAGQMTADDKELLELMKSILDD